MVKWNKKSFMKRPSIAFAFNLLLEPVLGASVEKIDKERVGSDILLYFWLETVFIYMYDFIFLV